jgi:alanyl-tRNA synthetase
MTEHLYYRDSFLYEFDAEVVNVVPPSDSSSRTAAILDRTAFYPTSGGQVFDTGWIVFDDSSKLRVDQVEEREDGDILHFFESPPQLEKGSRVRGLIDVARRVDHMQQHSGQHVLSAAFLRLFNIPTVSFHMGADYCSIDLQTNQLEAKNLTGQHVESAEALANEVVQDNRPVDVRFVTQEEARGLGLRKLPPTQRDELRLIAIRDFDLTACGGTHVMGTSQIGSILLRKTEKVRQGWRVEFVCGKRAIAAASRDYSTLAEAAGLLSSQLGEVPQQILKVQEESRAARRVSEQLQEELVDGVATKLMAETPETGGRKVVIRILPDRDVSYIKLLAQRLVRQNSAAVALLATTSGQPALVFAQTAGQPFDMGALMKETLASLGGRGGGSKDMAQGGFSNVEGLEAVLTGLGGRLRG